jgi:hypothetical protein
MAVLTEQRDRDTFHFSLFSNLFHQTGSPTSFQAWAGQRLHLSSSLSNGPHWRRIPSGPNMTGCHQTGILPPITTSAAIPCPQIITSPDLHPDLREP